MAWTPEIQNSGVVSPMSLPSLEDIKHEMHQQAHAVEARLNELDKQPRPPGMELSQFGPVRMDYWLAGGLAGGGAGYALGKLDKSPIVATGVMFIGAGVGVITADQHFEKRVHPEIQDPGTSLAGLITGGVLMVLGVLGLGAVGTKG